METSFPLPAQLPLPAALAAAAVVLLVVYAYWMALPKPLPGIPYNKGIGILGDIPEVKAALKRGTSFALWFSEMAQRHNSPLGQFFIEPFGPPMLYLTDHREIYDLMFHRKDFDRAKRMSQTFGTVISNHHIAMQSSDPRFKGNKDLIKDLMTPTFLTKVGAIYGILCFPHAGF